MRLGKEKLYVVSTYYHALIACLKQMAQPCDAAILCTAYIPEGEELARHIRESNLFSQTWYVGAVQEYIPENRWDFVFHFHKKNIQTIDTYLSHVLRFEDYKEINLFQDDTWMAHYLKSKRIHYRLMEDALDYFKIVSRGRYAYMLPKKGLRTFIKRAFRIGYLFFGEDGLADEIEVNDRGDLQIPEKHILEVPRETLFCRLTGDDWRLLKRIFLKDLPVVSPGKAVLLFTQPLWQDGFLHSEEEQIDFYREMRESLFPDDRLIIKAHPRDNTNYLTLGFDAVLINKNMPAELLEHTLNFQRGDYVPLPEQSFCPRVGEYVKLIIKE